ncbi:MAG: hypothetical protein L0Z70_05895, partial [Chloroflexi bacterium]|nr:hypothetical protein [Chloroflexota bacterium]
FEQQIGAAEHLMGRIDDASACLFILLIAKACTQSGVMLHVTFIALFGEHLHACRGEADAIFKRTPFFWDSYVHFDLMYFYIRRSAFVFRRKRRHAGRLISTRVKLGEREGIS